MSKINNTVTIKPEAFAIQEHQKLSKIVGVIDAKNLAKVLNVVGLTANPRKSKKNKITSAIIETLEKSPDLFRFKSKGLLISTMNCQILQRGRISLSFENPQFEGVLDGGHNMLAIGCFILAEYFGDQNHKEIKKIKKWDDFMRVWEDYHDELSDVLETFEFKVPIEVIYPEPQYEEYFRDTVLEISDARNNNSSLTAQTKADHKGYYEFFKACLDPVINENVEWKDNDIDKTIRSPDIVSLSLIPFYMLQEKGYLTEKAPRINPITIYSSKGKCVENYNKLFELYSDEDGGISNSMFSSALELMKDIPSLYDRIYKQFPDSYKNYSSRFGGISCVRKYEKGKRGGTYLPRQPKTKFYAEDCEYSYPDGFIIPIVVALSSIMKVENDKVIWAVENPHDFVDENLTLCIKILMSNIKENDYNPNTVGKSSGAYEGMQMAFAFALK